jgi:hypothetical protein
VKIPRLPSVDEDVEQLEFSYILGEIQNDIVTRWVVSEDSHEKTPRLLHPAKEEFRQDMKMAVEFIEGEG